MVLPRKINWTPVWVLLFCLGSWALAALGCAEVLT